MCLVLANLQVIEYRKYVMLCEPNFLLVQYHIIQNFLLFLNIAETDHYHSRYLIHEHWYVIVFLKKKSDENEKNQEHFQQLD